MLNLEKKNKIFISVFYKNNGHLKVSKTFSNGKDALGFLKKIFSDSKVPLVYRARDEYNDIKLPFPCKK